ncbi:hypothetical protein GGS20DRAFT_485928 [Poronia punctata]|nr:hypothetical protein GGS20DRAFT_485928 [Poronia punctata]
MGSNLDNVTSLPLDDPPAKSSFLSRLAAPLRSRTRNIADFHIRLKEPHRQYSAGDHVHGSVILSIVKPTRVTHLTVALHGYVRAFKSASAAAQVSTVNPAIVPHGSREGRYHGNGHASLFQDEVVLCGEGRLAGQAGGPGKFEFQFDLQFPDLELPSSIDFERGTIAYLVTATLTRPTPIAPTTSCEARVTLVEKLDVGLVSPPRERKVFLQTMKRRPKKKKPATPATITATKTHAPLTEIAETIPDRDVPRATGSSNNSNLNLGNAHHEVENLRDPSLADVRSEISGESAASNRSASYSTQGADASGDSAAGSKHSGHDEREITATVELLKGGSLPGDMIPVRIRVEHNRYMKSLHGIIVTLYRQGRVDYAPPVVSFSGLSKEDAKRLERDEYYPRSKTGLGGLSLSSAGSCSVFRKDLSQAVAPLILDPVTLAANITTAVRVPEGAFPSIRNVPGGLITFKYHVEVIVDLGGKLTGPSSGPSQPQQPTRMTSSASVRGTYGIDLNLVSNWNSTIIDTDHIRREKGVISVSFEVVVGTTDSSRSRGKAVERPAPPVRTTSREQRPSEENAYEWGNTYDGEEDYEYTPGDTQYPQSHYYGPHLPHPPLTSPPPIQYDGQAHGTQAPIYVPPPNLPAEGTLTEKERMRRAEERLLPSQPQLPIRDMGAIPGPSQPWAPNLSLDDAGQSSSIISPLSQDSMDGEANEGPSAPAFEELATGRPEHASDDKQELERRRLMAEASAPPEVPEDYEGGEADSSAHDWARPSAPWSDEPSAPTLEEDGDDDEYHGMRSSDTTGVSEPLPRYER